MRQDEKIRFGLVFFSALLISGGLGVFVECHKWWQDALGLFMFFWGLNIHTMHYDDRKSR